MGSGLRYELSLPILATKCSTKRRPDMCLRGKLLVCSLVDPELFDPVAQGAKRHSQYFGCRRLVVPGLFQSFHDGLTLHVFEMIAQCGSVRGGVAGACRRLGGRRPQL